MLCYVTRPDSVVMEVEVDAKANGEDCLNKVGGCAGTQRVRIHSDDSVSQDRRAAELRANFSLPASLTFKSFYYPRVPASVTAPLKLC